MTLRSLGGDGWRMRGFLGEETAVRAAVRPDVLDERGWIPARVPGSVVDDLWRAGEVPNPYVERNSRAAEWAADRAWLYATTLETAPLDGAERAWLRFDGLDFGGTIVLDGDVLGEHRSMFAPAEWEVTDRLRSGGRHRLLVVIPPAPESEPQMGRTSRVRVHKSRMTYGWDFCPRLVHQGIWRDVTLATRAAARIEDAWARSRIEADGRGTVDLRVALGGRAEAAVRIDAVLREGDRVVGQASLDTDAASVVELTLDAGRPRRWWPNGSVDGAPVVHRLDVRALDSDGSVLDRRAIAVGFRTVRLEPNEGGPAGARPYTLVVNDRPMFANGWNWVPTDVSYGVPRPERLGHLLRLTHGAGVNLLRVWGGGVIESESFYDTCDALGLLVWQEFSLSSSGFESTPSDDPAFVDALLADARAIVPSRRNHPSLAIWCGGNELEDAAGPLDDDRSPALAALASVVRDMDPDRAWLPTSPTGPQFSNRLAVLESDPNGLHDVHGPWEHQGLREQQRLYDAGTALLSSEFGVEGMTNRRTLEALITPEHRWPPTRANAVYRHLGEWWINEPLVREAFGGRLGDDLDTLRRASQWLQAEGLRYAVEANRRRWPRTSGTIPWQLNESFPNAWCTSAIDHRGDPKPAFFAVADAYAPVHACASYATVAWGGESEARIRAWAWSAAGAVAGASCDARTVDLEGRTEVAESWTVDLPSDGRAVSPGELVVPVAGDAAATFLVEVAVRDANGVPLAQTRVPMSRAPDLGPFVDVPHARLVVRCAADGDDWTIEIENVGDVAALGLVVLDDRPIDTPGWAEPSDGWLHVLPGESRPVTVRWADAPVAGRRVRIDGWNLEASDGIVVA